MLAFEEEVNALLADPDAFMSAVNAPAGKARVFAALDGRRLFVLDGGVVYRPEDWDKRPPRGAPDGAAIGRPEDGER